MHPVAGDQQGLYRDVYRYFAPVFPDIPPDVLERISDASYDYFQCLLAYDQVIDNPQDERAGEHTIAGFVFHERAVKALASIFPHSSNFWIDFDCIKDEYFSAIEMEKNAASGNVEFNEEYFAKLARRKSIFCLAAVSALSHLSGDFKYQQILGDSIISLHVGFQIFDDIDDFKSDLTIGQRSYVSFLVDRFIDENSLGVGAADILAKHKLLFISGIAAQQLQKARSYFESSYNYVADLPLAEYKGVILENARKADRLIWEIQQSLIKTESKLRLSNKKLNDGEAVVLSGQSIMNAISQGVDFLRSQLNTDNLWSDFLTSAGESTIWVTSYAGYMLSDVEISPPWLIGAYEKLCARVEKGVSFNEQMVQDGDSTSFYVGFSALVKREVSDISMQMWLRHQTEEGGWTTYRDPDALRVKLGLPHDSNVTGWTQPHVCVSAAAAMMAARCCNLSGHIFEKTVRFLLESQLESGEWKSYWWTSDIYATSFALQAICGSGMQRQHNDIGKACSWLTSQQTNDGSWKNPATGSPCPFYTALAMKALLVTNSLKYHHEISKTAKWLLANQMSDGSWRSKHILRIPSPQIVNPEEVKVWRKSSFGVNTLVDSHRRIFTTATVVNCLKSYMISLQESK